MLAVDIGNTSTRIASFRAGAVSMRFTFPTAALDIAVLINAFLEAADAADEPRAWIASVVPSANAIVDSAAGRAGLSRRFIKAGTDAIMTHRLRTPETTGVDRLLSALAARNHFFSGDGGTDGFVVLQCGSAATVDLVDANGIFLGGYILPGPGMWLRGLSSGAQLPDLSREVPDWTRVAVGDTTRAALLNGMQVALPVAVASAALLIGTEAGPCGGDDGLPVAVTGGWGEAVVPYIRSSSHYDRDLLLHGIRLFAASYQ